MGSRIICADCRYVLGDVISQLDNPVIVTDPPFDIGYRYGSYRDRMGSDEYMGMLVWMLSPCPCVVVHYPEGPRSTTGSRSTK